MGTPGPHTGAHAPGCSARKLPPPCPPGRNLVTCSLSPVQAPAPGSDHPTQGTASIQQHRGIFLGPNHLCKEPRNHPGVPCDTGAGTVCDFPRLCEKSWWKQDTRRTINPKAPGLHFLRSPEWFKRLNAEAGLRGWAQLMDSRAHRQPAIRSRPAHCCVAASAPSSGLPPRLLAQLHLTLRPEHCPPHDKAADGHWGRPAAGGTWEGTATPPTHEQPPQGGQATFLRRRPPRLAP